MINIIIMYIQLFYSHNVASEYINLNLHTALQLHIELPSLLTNASSKKITYYVIY